MDTAILFDCKDEDEPIGRGVVLKNNFGNSELLVQFWGGDKVTGKHQPCWYTNDEQEKKMGGKQYYYGKPVKWQVKRKKKGKRVWKKSVPVTISVNKTSVLCDFVWESGYKIPLPLLQEHCPELFAA